MADKRWHVVPGADDRIDPKASCWTVSLSPDKPGWDTDMGCGGYGLTKALAEELADAANAVWSGAARRGLPKWAHPIHDEQQISYNNALIGGTFGGTSCVNVNQEDDGA